MDNDDYDTPWKEVVTHHFPEFMAFYFPHAQAAIDWSRPHAFLDQEFAALSRDAELGRRLLATDRGAFAGPANQRQRPSPPHRQVDADPVTV